MNAVRRLAGTLLAGVFIVDGSDAIRNSESKVKNADVVARPLGRLFPFLDRDTESLVRFNGAVQVGAGTLLALGKFQRLSAVVLIASVLPTTYAGHRFWEEADPATRAQQQTQFLKNLGLVGGLLSIAGSDLPTRASRR